MPRTTKREVAKENKLKSKKRKLEAFLNLVQRDSEVPEKKKKSSDSFSGSFKALKDELKKYRAKQIIEPVFHLKDLGRTALVQFSGDKKSAECTGPLFFADIYHLLLKALLGSLSPFPLHWCTLERPQHITKVVVIDLEGLSESDIFDINSELVENCKLFQYVFEVVSSNPSFASELSTFHKPSGVYYQNEKNVPYFPVSKDNSSRAEAGQKYVVSKLHLLLSPIQLAMENFPLPSSVFQPSKTDKYVFTKESYGPVTEDSPMFAMDCEMCRTSAGNEVTRVAIVDENLETFYHTLVKPERPITNYLTRYSGITPQMLKNVTTTLRDVHEDIRRILPRDAILCGQSLNCDLHAMKMIHPYVIDTSVIFNTHGIRSKKTSLKQLIKTFFQETIQNHGESGHHPVEDSIAAMKLVQLKLQNSVEFGDAVLGFTFHPKKKSTEERLNSAIPESVKPDQYGFFDRIFKFSRKKVCLIGTDEALSSYCIENSNDNICKKNKPSNKKVLKSTVKNINEFDLLISHLTLKDERSSVHDVVDRLKQAYESFPNRTLFLLMANHNNTDCKTFSLSYCMAVLKNVK